MELGSENRGIKSWVVPYKEPLEKDCKSETNSREMEKLALKSCRFMYIFELLMAVHG